MVKEPSLLTMQLASTLTPNQQAIFYGEYNHRARDYNTALLLAITTGWWAGGHKFYLGKPIQGILHILFFYTAIPFILTVIDIFNMRRTVNQINDQIAQEVLAKVRML